ncbi:DNA-3-methyladenine glycosylase I [Gallaecimonas pentaromativorans]|uniref:DNA-3-methyladenine glycosylase I n=1 Tax=Gallaecimonas pentaromativorans TaxID=584787 RepID=A0A3N1PBN3_9GAMM|nr:DNA-3-methyladenine glycosylase I [Gallaecimonas pentaromativorans]ROQ24407.1 DNA-3-methyladenine glycosylase I [Gallaecimonas pentaromativorans]
MDTLFRCPWCGDDPLYQHYHDTEWGRPVHDDRTLFEFLILEGAQAGLSWITVLRKRQAYRDAYHQFDVHQIAAYADADQQRLLANPGIVRNRLKVAASIDNAKAFIRVQQEFGSFDAYLWAFVGGQPIVNQPRTLSDVPAVTPLAEQISKDLKKRGFRFVGPTIIYAFMQAVGMVNDHLLDCHVRNLPG